MSLRSKNFLFRRKAQDGTMRDNADTDSWYPNHNDEYLWNEVSLPLAAGGFYGSTNGLHTLSFTLRNFSGRLYVQATLASDPKEEDWFNIEFKESCRPYMEFTDYILRRSDGFVPTMTYGTTGTFAETVIGNFTFLRVGISRDYITEAPSMFQKQYAGKIEEVLINF